MQTDPIPRHDPYLALRFAGFRFFIGSKLLATVAVQAKAVVIGWQLYDITQDPLALGFVGLAEAGPAIGVALVAGHVADTYMRKRIVQAAQLTLFVVMCWLLLFTWHQEVWVARYGTWPIYGVLALSGLARGFLSPANFGLMGEVVPRHAYMNSSTWNSSIWQFGAIVGPAVGGLVYGFFGAAVSYALSAGLLLLAVGCVACIPGQTLLRPAVRGSMRERLLSGVRYVFQHKIILYAISLDLFAVLFGGAVALLPIFAADILAVGPKGLGALRAAPAVGSTLVAFALAHRAPMQHAGRNMLLAVAGFGLSMIFFALSTSFYFSLFWLAVSGAFDNVSVVIRSTILQLLTPNDMRGRVSSVNSMFVGSSNEIGAFESGLTARLMGTVTSVVFGGLMTLLVVAWTARQSPTLRRLNLQKLGLTTN